jgi:hypothetical protein
MTISTTILEQLGGGKFIAMTGANQFVGSSNSLRFKLPANLTAGRGNLMVITLDPSDTYTVTLYKNAKMHCVVVAERSLVYADSLRDVFESLTGLRTSLGTMGLKRSLSEVLELSESEL